MAYSDAHAAEVLGLRKLGSDNSLVQAEGLKLIYRSVALSGNFEQTVRVEHEGLSHFHTHPQLQLCENFANNEKPFYLCILVNTWFF